ncbi:helix-turn-helix domain-containing protein [Alicyclobacillus acidocaldarius]|uniref:Transcriptional regulator, XRE family n=1 Tax=Alicyclobacillus acidocaldarius subsp. acidocaldarius (strain ATCC 27009 / DSM 446 / BCRC 14685 / JCM 5260 / KCTC 1825 / NBRC 15652 / NCIMB 11725 / NRRL B-14509 / 104-IA) TaxID=521098 RepID=C8WYE3_ALIAD|nr:helix-turn-helix transcriptional regulator [Alicyclobacillus acidocaldarius]ACV60037.1 transcriptional regulator, XRE family [Alicyclobacillus acidocaldarius subsp. acidocaldarius DSM 446]
MPRLSKDALVPPEKRDTFIAWLINKRDELGFTQKDMADFLGLSLSYYNAIENRKRNLSAKLVIQLASKLPQGPRFAVQLLGPEVVGKYMNLIQLPPEKEEEYEAEDALLDAIQQREKSATDYLGLLRSVLHHSNAVMAVSVQPNLCWFGLTPEDVAIITPVTDLKALIPGQLVYVVDRTAQAGEFAFVRALHGKELTSVESTLMMMLDLPRDTTQLFEWGIDPRRALMSWNADDPNLMVCEVVTICKASPSRIVPLTSPGYEEWSLLERKTILQQGIVYNRLRQEMKETLQKFRRIMATQ